MGWVEGVDIKPRLENTAEDQRLWQHFLRQIRTHFRSNRMATFQEDCRHHDSSCQCSFCERGPEIAALFKFENDFNAILPVRGDFCLRLVCCQPHAGIVASEWIGDVFDIAKRALGAHRVHLWNDESQDDIEDLYEDDEVEVAREEFHCHQQENRRLAMAMALHPRLGKLSQARAMPSDQMKCVSDLEYLWAKESKYREIESKFEKWMEMTKWFRKHYSHANDATRKPTEWKVRLFRDSQRRIWSKGLVKCHLRNDHDNLDGRLTWMTHDCGEKAMLGTAVRCPEPRLCMSGTAARKC